MKSFVQNSWLLVVAGPAWVLNAWAQAHHWAPLSDGTRLLAAAAPWLAAVAAGLYLGFCFARFNSLALLLPAGWRTERELFPLVLRASIGVLAIAGVLSLGARVLIEAGARQWEGENYEARRLELLQRGSLRLRLPELLAGKPAGVEGATLIRTGKESDRRDAGDARVLAHASFPLRFEVRWNHRCIPPPRRAGQERQPFIYQCDRANAYQWVELPEGTAAR